MCSDCGRSFSTVHGFLYREGDAYAVYHALLQREHPSTAVLTWRCRSEAGTRKLRASDRTRVGIRIWPDGDELKLHITAVDESSWGDSETFGRLMDRSDVLGTPTERDATPAAEFVLAHDERVREHLR